MCGRSSFVLLGDFLFSLFLLLFFYPLSLSRADFRSTGQGDSSFAGWSYIAPGLILHLTLSNPSPPFFKARETHPAPHATDCGGLYRHQTREPTRGRLHPGGPAAVAVVGMPQVLVCRRSSKVVLTMACLNRSKVPAVPVAGPLVP